MSEGSIYKLSQLRDKIDELINSGVSPDAQIMSQVTFKDGSAWNCWFNLTEFPNATNRVYASMAHESLKGTSEQSDGNILVVTKDE